MTQRKTALVVGVGASQGLGAASARRFAREGLHVVVAGRTQGKLDEVVHEIKSAGGSIEALSSQTPASKTTPSASSPTPIATAA